MGGKSQREKERIARKRRDKKRRQLQEIISRRENDPLADSIASGAARHRIRVSR